MSVVEKILLGVVLLVLGFAGGVKYHAGVDARKALAAAELDKSDRIQQRAFNEKAAGQHAAQVAKLATQLGDARVQISKLPGRECFGTDTVGVLNAIGQERATAGEPAGPAQAAAGVAGDRFATDGDVATAIATCRAWYGDVSSQLNQILDIEDARFPPAPAATP